MSEVTPPKDHLHGMTLEAILNALVEHFGWFDLGCIIRINCFNDDPSIKSSLKFLRKTPWARSKVEALYISMMNSRMNSRTNTVEVAETPVTPRE